MKVLNMMSMIAAIGLMNFAPTAQAQQASQITQFHHAHFLKAIAACQNASFNLDSNGQPMVTLPTPVPGQRPNLTPDQWTLIQQCKQAGILHRHHRQPASN